MNLVAETSLFPKDEREEEEKKMKLYTLSIFYAPVPEIQP